MIALPISLTFIVLAFLKQPIWQLPNIIQFMTTAVVEEVKSL
jgi:hypothetical protein